MQEPAGELGISFAAHRPVGEDGSFLLLLAPAVDAAEKAIPRDVVLCVDTSGSMAGPKMEQARNALRYAVRTLSPEDRFAIVAFATEPRLFRGALVRAGEAEKEAALAFVDSLQAVGGTFTMALRPEVDERVADTEGSTIDQLIEEFGFPVPLPPELEGRRAQGN